MSNTERVGVGRRIDDVTGHCDLHADNTSTLHEHSKDLSAIRSQNKLLVWLIPLILGGIGIMLNYYVSQTNQSIEKMTTNMSSIQAIVANATVQAAVNNQKLDMLESNVQELMNRNHR